MQKRVFGCIMQKEARNKASATVQNKYLFGTLNYSNVVNGRRSRQETSWEGDLGCLVSRDRESGAVVSEKETHLAIIANCIG